MIFTDTQLKNIGPPLGEGGKMDNSMVNVNDKRNLNTSYNILRSFGIKAMYICGVHIAATRLW